MKEKIELLGFADDATGAMDVAGALHSRGYSVQVNMESCKESISTAVVVTNLSSRYDNPELSNEKLAAALHDTTTGDTAPRAFLKVDSTLRGNLNDNRKVLQEFTGDKPVFIAPALPFYGRICVNGIYLVKGVPVHTTEFAGDRKFQYDTSTLSEHFPGSVHIGSETLEGGVDAVLEAVDRSTEKSFTFDTRDQTDLEVIAEASMMADASVIGSSGIARAFPHTEAPATTAYSIPDLPTLFVIGSIHSASRAQKHLLTGALGTAIEVSPVVGSGNMQANQKAHATVKQILASGRSTVLSTPDAKIDDVSRQVELERLLGECSDVLDIPHHLVIVGGETVRTALHARDINSLLLRGEYEDGVPIAAQSASSAEVLITKAGGFGHPGTLTNIHNFIRRG